MQTNWLVSTWWGTMVLNGLSITIYLWSCIKTISHKLTIINPHVNYFEAAHMIQMKIGAQQDFKHLMQVGLHFHSREPLKNLQCTTDHIATIFNPFITGGNKKAYIFKQTWSLKLQICLSVYDVLVPPGLKIV